MRRILTCLTAVFLMQGGGHWADAADEAVQPPYARIPRNTPDLHPSLNMATWLAGAGFAGMTDFHAGSHLDWPDAGWFLSYDDTNLYVACLTRTPNEHTRFRADCKDNDDPRILTDDHLEFQISFAERALAATEPFYKIMVNPMGAVSATLYNWQPGQHKQGWAETVKVAVHQQSYMQCSWWCTKLAIPLKELGITKLDGTKALAQCVLVSGFQYYCGWVGAGWMEWTRFGELEFDPHAPGYCLNGTFPRLVREGGFTVSGSFCPKTGSDVQERLSVAVANRADGKTLFDKTFTSAPTQGGERGNFNFVEGMPTAKKGNVFTVEIRQQKPAAAESLLYRCDVPFRKPDDTNASALQNWIRNHAVNGRADTTLNFACFPSYDALHLTLDTRVYVDGVAPEQLPRAKRVIAADRFRATVRALGKKETGTVAGSIANCAGEGLVRCAEPLPEGEHKLIVDVLSGDEVVDTQERTFVRKRFPWEHNQIGLDKVVIPPYAPIARNGETLKVWGREYDVAPTGFFSGIRAQGHGLLNGAISVVSTQEGKEFSLTPVTAATISMVPGQKLPDEYQQYWYQPTCPKPTPVPTDGYQARIAAESALGKIQVRLDATMEYEGWYQIALDLIPQGKVAVDSLDLLIPFAALPTPLMRFEREYSLEGLGAVPTGEGVLFESTRLPRVTGTKGSLPPFIFVGNYSRGLWWMAESDQGWLVDDAKPVAQLERRNGQLLLRLRFVNTPSVLEHARQIRFAMQAVPMKPLPAHYRKIAWKYPEPQFAHDTSGYRYYGSGVDGFTLYTDADYAGLREFYHEMDLKNHLGQVPGHTGRWYGMEWLRPARRGFPLVEYGSTWMTSAGMDEFPTFMGEWCYTNDWGKYSTEAKFKGRMNYGRTYTWTTDPELTPILTTANRSYQDCLVWHMTRIAEKAGLNGSFYDNYSSTLRYAFLPGKVGTEVAGDMYRRDDGSLQGLHAPFRRHVLLKRMATALWLLGRPPFQLVAWEPDVSFADASWFVEGPWYHESVEKDFIEKGISPELFQGTTCKPGQVGYLNSSFAAFLKDGKPVGFNQRAQRLAFGYVLLNDLGSVSGLPDSAKELLPRMDKELRFFDGAEFRPYWEETEWLAQKPEGFLISAYVHPEKSRALLVVVNRTEKAVPLELALNGALLLGRELRSARNFETGTDIPVAGGRLTAGTLDRHALMFVAVE